MKISTITCHDVYNHGASLQAYALMTYLNNQGHSVEIIDYKPYYMGNLYKLSNIDNPAWEKNFISKGIYLTLKLPGRLISLKRKKNFDNFTKNYLNVGTYKYESNEDLKNNLPDSDAFICGSDQIWNSLHANGKDPAFYLDFVPENKIKAAYAASFATDTISDEFKPMTKSLVEKLDGVGVREESGVKIVKDLGIEKAVNVLDPVFLLEKENWDKIANKDFNEKYILIYDFDKSTIIEEVAREISKKKGYKIYTINVDKPKYADKYFNLDGPETFVSLVKNAQFVISNSFHAAVFSLVYEKDFVIVNRTESINTRMRDLLSSLTIGDRLIGKDYDINKVIEHINYDNVRPILKEKIDFSKKYLEDILSIQK